MLIILSPLNSGVMDFEAKIKYGEERNLSGATRGTNLGGGKDFADHPGGTTFSG